MVPRPLERAILSLSQRQPSPRPRKLDLAVAVERLRAAIEEAEHLARRRALARTVRAWAAHLVLKGDSSE
jgi:hypothetical protein